MATDGISSSYCRQGGMARTPPHPASGTGLSRRRALQILAFGGGYLGQVFLARARLAFSPHPPASLGSWPGTEPISFKFEVVRVNATGRIVQRKPGQARGFSQVIGDSRLEMVALPSGQLMMGGETQDTQGLAEALPQPPVTLQAFSMGKYLVTQAQWRAVAALPKVQLDLEPAPFGFKGDNRPAEGVNWYDAMEFCARLSAYSGQLYTLPSEAQWEYACRAGTTTPFYFGETVTTDLANYHGLYPYGLAPQGAYRAATTDVDRFPPNPFGLYDMHGNVWEWCLDADHQGSPQGTGGQATALARTPGIGIAQHQGQAGPLTRRPRLSADLCHRPSTPRSAVVCRQGYSWRVLRGGSWFDGSSYCRCAHRTFLDPLGRNYFGGFRVVSLLPKAFKV